MESEATLRLGIFLSLLVVIILLEKLLPRRNDISRKRWASNLSIVVIDVVTVRVLLPAGAVGAAFFSQVNGYGLFNIWLTDTTAGLIAAFFLLDLAIYFQHRIFHAVPLLWRLHRVHHSDIGFDVTTALRFHPLEILLSLLIKMSLIVILGAPIISVIIFEIVLNGAAMFNHANMNITKGLDRLLRLFVVTPDMHRIHHSVHNKETNSNFGFNIPWWDRLFGTYTDQPRDGHDEMLIGLAEFRQQPDQRLDKLLVQPFRKTV